ncbi:MAG: hypothetical protein AAF329_08700 [Cyanobacteria bacterium P01_A01_bin.17]
MGRSRKALNYLSMTLNPQAEEEQSQVSTPENSDQSEEILCPHCRRTATNGIKCQGICVSDSDY